MFNSRVVIFAGVMLFLIFWPIYSFLNEKLARGVHDRGSYQEVDLRALGEFYLDSQTASLSDIPAQFRALDGHKVRLQGEIFGTEDAGNNTVDFQLLWQIKSNYFSPPHVQERVYCSVAEAKLKYRSEAKLYTVFGILHVGLKREKLLDGKLGPIAEVYHLDAESVEPSKSD